MAERQGLLQHRHISPIQKKALLILNFLDEIEKSKNDLAALKRAFLAARIAEPSKLFPEVFADKEKDITEVAPEEEAEGTDYDYSGVTWQSGASSFDEYERLMKKVGAAQNGMLNGDMLAEAREPSWTDWS